MSQFLGTTSGTNGLGIQCAANDIRLVAGWYDNDAFKEVAEDEPWALDGFRSPWWPRGMQLDASGDEMREAIWCDRPELNSGAVAAMGITGYTRDAYGSIVTSATVKLFNTSTVGNVAKDTMLSEATSDPTTGFYQLYTPFYSETTHYIVCFKSGTPNIQGVTVNNLVSA